tara:strand:+ start:81 stop:269 length:189 start_codon:yes stop_codon:yes gene_type:complete
MNELIALLEAQLRVQRELRGIKSGIQDLISDGVSPLLRECIDKGFITLKINHDKVYLEEKRG